MSTDLSAGGGTQRQPEEANVKEKTTAELAKEKLRKKTYEYYEETKWDSIKCLYIPFCILYFCFVFILTGVLMKIKPDYTKIDEINQKRFINDYCGRWLTGTIFFTQLSIMVYKFFRYKNSGIPTFLLKSWINIGVLILSYCAACKRFTLYWHWIVLLLNFTATFNLYHFIKKIPELGLHILVLTQIFFSFLKFLPAFIMFILPFSVTFHLILDEKEQYSTDIVNNNSTDKVLENDAFLSFFNTFIHTLVMMIGEFDFKESIAKKESWITSSIFCLFLFMITIFLMNILIGISVTETSELLQNAEKTQENLRAETVKYLNNVLCDYLKYKIWVFSIRMKNFSKECKRYFFELFTCICLVKEDVEKEIEEEDSWKELENLVEKKFDEFKKELILEIRDSMTKMQKSIAEINQKAKKDINQAKKETVIKMDETMKESTV